jgi:deazaflavin-dependent oxidoreductase (nitroreductase family)
MVRRVPTVPRAMARINKRVTNKIQGVWAPYLPPYASIEHVGRMSGKHYSTPVVASIHGDHLYVAVLYGEESDWVRNLLAAEGGEVRRLGRTRRIEAPKLRSARDVPGLAGHALGRVSGRVLEARLG